MFSNFQKEKGRQLAFPLKMVLFSLNNAKTLKKNYKEESGGGGVGGEGAQMTLQDWLPTGPLSCDYSSWDFKSPQASTKRSRTSNAAFLLTPSSSSFLRRDLANKATSNSCSFILHLLIEFRTISL